MAAKKTSKKTAKKATRKKSAKKKSAQRPGKCIKICGENGCIRLCQDKAVSGDCYPCKICSHGNFCENDYICLSCGTPRDHQHKPYKGV